MADAKPQPNYMAIGMAGLMVLIGSGVLLRHVASINQMPDRRTDGQPIDADDMTSEWMQKIREQMEEVRS